LHKVRICGLYIVIDAQGKVHNLKDKTGDVKRMPLFSSTVKVLVDGETYNVPRNMIVKI